VTGEEAVEAIGRGKERSGGRLRWVAEGWNGKRVGS